MKQAHPIDLTRIDAVRFWSRVNKCGPVPGHRPELGSCWLWTGARTPSGYGQIKQRGSGLRYAHRVSAAMSGVLLDPNMVIDHLCRNRQCVNSAHLEQVSWRENVERNEQSPTTKNAVKTVCGRGHALTGDNLRTRVRNGKPMRICRECTRALNRVQKRRDRAA